MNLPRLMLLTIPLLVQIGVGPSWAGATAAESLAQAKSRYQRLLDSPKKQLHRDQWQAVIDRFLSLPGSFPGAPEGAVALYHAGQAGQGLYRVSRLTADARQAAGFYLRIPSEFPNSPLADDGLVLAAGIEADILKDFSAAWGHFQEAVARYPQGDQAATAKSRRDSLAQYAPLAPPPQPGSRPPAEPAPKAGGPARLTGIRYWSNPGNTRVVLDVSSRIDYLANLLPGDSAKGISPRLYIDLAGTAPGSEVLESTTVNDGLLQQIRTGRPDGDRVRVVLDLVSIQEYKIFPLVDPFRIVIDVAGTGAPELKDNPPELTVNPPSSPSSGSPSTDGIAGILATAPTDRPLKVQLPPSASGSLRRIVVDPGHGGKDPGAIGPNGVQEKEVTLALARELARQIEQDLGCEVVLTRNSDIFLPLEERTAIANKVGADLFISVHANASPKGNAYGIETYYLNFSKNDQAVAVAARENGTSLKQVGDLELILLDLMANSKINESSRLAAEIQRALVTDLDRHYSAIRDLGVRQGPFYVLLGATMPSVLVETAFISHNREEARLTDPAFRTHAARAISRGVRNYATALKMIAAQ